MPPFFSAVLDVQTVRVRVAPLPNNPDLYAIVICRTLPGRGDADTLLGGVAGAEMSTGVEQIGE